MERDLAQVARMRQVALKDVDEKALSQISALERKAVENYQRRVAQILAGNIPEDRRSPRSKPEGTSEKRVPIRGETSRRRGLFGLGWPFSR